MRNVVAVLLALLWSGAVVSDPVTAKFKSTNECRIFTPVEDVNHPNLVYINLTELECLGIVFKDLEPWQTFSNLDPAHNPHQHIPINKQSLGFILRLADTLRGKPYNRDVSTILTIDSIALIDSGGAEVVITKDTNDPEDWRMQLKRPRNQDVLWVLSYYLANKAILFEDNNPNLFKVIVRRHPDFIAVFNNTFHRTTLSTSSK